MNINDVLLGCLGILYSILRLVDPAPFLVQELDPTSTDNSPGLLCAWSVFSLVIAILSAVKTMNLLRVFPDFGKQVQLVSQVWVDSGSFLAFYFLWLFFFAIFKALLGNEIDLDDYPGLHFTVAAMLIEYRNSVGDIMPPTYSFWSQDLAGSRVMVGLNQFNFISFQVFMNVILLNFLIAIISQSYEQVMDQQELHIYKQKAELIWETAVIFNNQPWVEFMLITNAVGGGDSSEWRGVVKSVKQCMTEENKVLRQQMS